MKAFDTVNEYKCLKCKRRFKVTSTGGGYCSYCDRKKELIARYLGNE